jgi:hypothetical protein
MEQTIKGGKIIDIKLSYDSIVLTDDEHNKYSIEPIEFLKSINNFDLEAKKKRTRTWVTIKY